MYMIVIIAHLMMAVLSQRSCDESLAYTDPWKLIIYSGSVTEVCKCNVLVTCVSKAT